MGHEYVDTPLKMAQIIKDSIKHTYLRRALEDLVEFEEKFYGGFV